MPYVWAACRLLLRDGAQPNEAMIDRRIQMLRGAGLCDNECERLRHIRHREARLASVGARIALLWAVLGDGGVHDWEQAPDVTRMIDRPLSSFGRDVQGAPRPMGSHPISLAHCRGMAVAVQACEGRIGVDVEPTDRPVHHPSAMAERFFSPAERQAWMESGEDMEQFLRIWTRKEALGKALGQGLDRIGELDTASADACFEEIVMDGYIVTVCQRN
jgi:hypothetical protein